MPQGNFFAVGKPQFQSACELGLNSAILLLVMACGSSRNNMNTSWSAQAATRYAGISWRKAKIAIELLQEHKIVDKLTTGKHPRYSLNKPADPKDLIWLPNSLILPIDSGLAPIAKLRQTQCLELLRLFIELYTYQPLESRSYLLRTPEPSNFEKTIIRDLGRYSLCGFKKLFSTSSLNTSNPEQYMQTAATGGIYRLLEFIGLVESDVYLAEADTLTSELIHPVTFNETPNELIDAISNFKKEGYDYVIPIRKEILSATLINVWRLTHQPKTTRTVAEHDIYLENCKKFSTTYRQIHLEFKELCSTTD